MLSVLHVTFSFEVGGSEILAARLAKKMAERGWKMSVCAVFHGVGPVSEDLRRHGIECIALDYVGTRRHELRRKEEDFVKFVRRNKVDVIHVQHSIVFHKLRRVFREMEIPVVLTEHADQPFRESWRKRRVGRKSFKSADSVTVIHDDLERYFSTSFNMAQTNIRVIENGVDLQEFNPSNRHTCRATLSMKEGQFVIGAVGRIEPVKDFQTLLRSFAIVARKNSRAVLCVVGDGSEMSDIVQLADELGIANRTMFLGRRSNVAEIMPAFDLLVVSSLAEGVPLAVLEALACGVPCVSTDVGGVGRILEYGCGCVVPVSDSEGIAQAILRIADSKSVQGTMGRAAREVALVRFDEDAMVSRYADLYKSLVKRRSSA